MKLVRLTSGEEVIGKVRDSADSIYITDGFSLVVTEPGKIGFIPFMPYAKEQEMQINKRFEYNFALEYAVAWANKLNKPLLIYEDLTRACRFSHGVRSLNVGLASMFRTFLV